jgi:hypothetical protein
VREGQTLATIDRREIDAQADAATASVAVATAGVDAAEAGLSNATTELERARNLFEKGALPRQRLDAAETANKAALAQRELARASLAQAQAAQRRARECSATRRFHRRRSGRRGTQLRSGRRCPGICRWSSSPTSACWKLEAGVSELGRAALRHAGRGRLQARRARSMWAKRRHRARGQRERNRHFRVRDPCPNRRRAAVGDVCHAHRDRARHRRRHRAARAVTTRAGKRCALVVTGETVKAVDVTEGPQTASASRS